MTTRFIGLSGPSDPNEPPPGALCLTERGAHPLARGLAGLIGTPEAAARQAATALAWVGRAHDRGRTLDAYAAFFRRLARERQGARS